MKFLKEQYFTIIIAIISLTLLYLIFKMIHYLVVQKYIIECFSNNQEINESTSHSVDLPITTTYSCQNFCSPTAKCAITGGQCLADIDCQGCQPGTPSKNNFFPFENKTGIQGNDSAGKLTPGITPQYSSLTAGYGTKEKIITNNMYDKPLQANFGINTWSKSFNEGNILFNERYKPDQLQFMPNYPPMYSITGEFMNDGPLPSNY
jgi:hypothetical protein